jgi:NAD(P)-dependent dehydrogenase (short-subunit alcohol dehydrogenase family)
MSYSLAGKIAIVTGANQGLGFKIARSYIQSGASVALCARDENQLSRARDFLGKYIDGDQRIYAMPLDVSIERDVNGFIESVLREFKTIDILVNNAGIYGPKGDLERTEWSDWVSAIQINLLGSVLMCRGVLPTFKDKGSGKVIQISGGGATSPLPMISAYAASKAGVIRFMETLAEEVRPLSIDVNAIAPGALNTRMLDEIILAGPDKVGEEFYKKAVLQKETGSDSIECAAQLATFLASDISNGISGKLISAVWDNWENFPSHLDELKNSDVYTLRRITGRDRDMSWGDK